MHTNHPAIPALYPPTTLELMLCQQKTHTHNISTGEQRRTQSNNFRAQMCAVVCVYLCLLISRYVLQSLPSQPKKTYSPICERFGWQFSGQNHFVKHIHQTLQCTSAMSGGGTSSTVVMRLISRSQTDKHIPTDHVVEMVQANNILSR